MIHSITSIINGIILVNPHLLFGGESGLWKIKWVLYGLIYKFLGETTKDNHSFCDGKGVELYNVGKYILDLPNVIEQKKKYLITSKM